MRQRASRRRADDLLVAEAMFPVRELDHLSQNWTLGSDDKVRR